MDSCLWRTDGFVYFLLTFIQMATSHDFLSTYCVYFNVECCREPQVQYVSYSLRNDLAKLRGQPFVSSHVPSFLDSHFNIRGFPSYSHSEITKPTCFYLHGDTGTGKTFLTRLIIKNIYRYGTSSRFVKFFHLRKDYFEDGKDTRLTDIMTKTIHDKVFSCPQSLFVFDGYSDCWFKVVDYISRFKKDFMEAIFIFIQNSDVQHIHAYMQKKQSHKNAMKYEDLLESGRENKFLENANLIYVPFLPMHREDVRICINDQLNKLKVPWTTSQKEVLITEIAALIEFTNDISVSGCKKVADKTALFLTQYNRRYEL